MPMYRVDGQGRTLTQLVHTQGAVHSVERKEKRDRQGVGTLAQYADTHTRRHTHADTRT